MVCTLFAAALLEARIYNFELALPTVYFAPGLFLAALYVVDAPARRRMLVAMLVAQASGSIVTGVAPWAAVLMALMIAGQAWVGASVLRMLAPEGLDFTRARVFGFLAVVALLVAPLSGVLIEQLLAHADPALFGMNPALASPAVAGKMGNLFRSGILVGWILPHALGIVLATPLTIGFATQLRHSQAAWLSRERVLILACNFVAAGGIFFSDGHSFLFLICPPLVWAGLRLGVRDTASAILVSLVIASIAAAHGHGPAEVLQTAPALRPLFLELAYLCACACIMPIAAALERRRRLEQDLASSLEFTGQILRNMHEIVFRADHQGRWTFLNPAWEQITGYPVAETLGHDTTEQLLPIDRVIFAAACTDLANGEVGELNLEQRLRRRDGEIRDICFNVRAIRDADGEFIGTTGTISDMSEHRRHIEALETSERRFRQLCDTAPIGIVRCDGHGLITYANQKLELIGVTRDRLIGLPWLDAFGIQDPELAAQLDDALQFPGAVFEHELSYDDALGLSRWLIITATGEFETKGQMTGFIAAVNDITERKAAETALNSRTEELRLLADNVNDVVFRLGLDGLCRYVTPSVRDVIGAEPAQLVGRTHFLNIHPDDGREFAEEFLKLTQGAVRHSTLAYRLLPEFPDADYIWVEANCRVLRDPAGNPYEVVAVLRDITERKAAETALIGKTEELHLLANNINDMIFRIGLDRTYLYASPTVREIMGLDPERLIGIKSFTTIHPDDMPSVDEAFALFNSGAVRHYSFSFRALPAFPDADYVWFEANCRVLRDDAGQPCEVVFATRDITDRKLLELDISEARQRAELATQAKSAFIANLSHEIRTPMNGVIGLTELLLGRELDGPSRRYARLISESGAAMMHLLNDILDISKIDSGRMQLNQEEFDLHRCLANALSLMQAGAGSKALELRLEIAPEVPRLMLGDSLRLRQVLANLIGNAVKFTEVGHVTVSARCVGAELEIAIADTGIGIAAEQLATVFDEFVQANAQIAGGYGGTGLGLSISRRIAEAMGGTLTLASRHGQGTTLTLRIPAVFIAEPTEVAPLAAAPAPASLDQSLRVLVAEDNRTNQIIINGMLQRLGHKSALAETGVAAIALAEQAAAAGEPFDLVLMDVQMPEMDGIEATTRLRQMGFDAARLPIIAVTASGFQDDIDDCLAAGMQGHLTKPMRLADLKLALAALLPSEADAGADVGPAQGRPIEINSDS
jgi:PAS domain S-box-containing protein